MQSVAVPTNYACMIIDHECYSITHDVGKKILIVVYRTGVVSVVLNHAITLYFIDFKIIRCGI